jgi:hypothetical protein
MRKDAIVFTLLVALFAAARLWGLADYCLDCDEIWSLRFARQDWGGLLTAVAEDVSHPPLFYLLLKAWIAVGGESLVWLRLFPAVTAIACVVPLLLFCRSLRLGWAETNLAVALLAVNGFLIYFAQQLRMFDLLQFFALCSLWRFVKFVEAPAGDRRNWASLALVNVLLVYSHYWGWVLVGTEGLYLLLCRRDKVLPFAVGVLVAVACFVPWVVAVAWAALHRGSAVAQIQWIGKPGWADLVRFYAKLTGGFRLPGTTAVGLALFLAPVVLWAGRLAAGRARLLPCRVRCGWAGASPSRADDRQTFTLLALVAVVPPVLTFAASHALPQSVWAERQLTFVAGPFLMLVAAAVWRLPRPAARVVPAACCTWAAAAGLAAVAAPPKIAWDRLAADLVEAEPAGPVTVYAADAHVAWCLGFYLDEAHQTRFTVVTGAEPAGERFWVAYREPQTGTESLDRLIARGYRAGPAHRSGTQWQTAAVVPVRRAAGGEEAEHPPTETRP